MRRFVWVLLVAACHGDRDFDEDGWYEPKDCDDGNPNAHPEAEEVAYDGIDQDCDGTDLVDRDEDGFQAVEAGGPDCNDFDAESFPGAKEVPYNGVDEDCDNWDDNDFDHDGFAAMGHGGEDCNDEDPIITPLDIDGDGFSPCTGDCDETDDRRNEDAEPICGNGFDDDCDEVSDCTLVGVLPLESLQIGVLGREGTFWLGSEMLAPGDLDDNGQNEIVLSGQREEGLWSVWVLPADLTVQLDETAAWARLDTPFEPSLYALGDLDGDGVPEMGVATPQAGPSDPALWVFSEISAGAADASTEARLTVVGQPADDVGSSVTVLGSQLVIGATGLATVQLMSASATGMHAFGEDGAQLRGNNARGAGAAVLAYDSDGDGREDLLVSEEGDAFGFESNIYLVLDPPTSGTSTLEAEASSKLVTTSWGPTSTEMVSGDLDGDGRADAVVGAPFANSTVGAVMILLTIPAGTSPVEDSPVQRLGLGDDTFGWSLLAQDFDGDGQEDLVVGAPAAWGAGGGASKPGEVYLWYGPIEQTLDHTYSADLLIQGSYTLDSRTFHGAALVLEDVDGDGGRDLLTSSPLLGPGEITFLPGGLTGLYGF